MRFSERGKTNPSLSYCAVAEWKEGGGVDWRHVAQLSDGPHQVAVAARDRPRTHPLCLRTHPLFSHIVETRRACVFTVFLCSSITSCMLMHSVFACFVALMFFEKSTLFRNPPLPSASAGSLFAPRLW